MKATGVVRRIDDLGRIVIPKELRRTMRIREGDSLEIFIEGENIILSKYKQGCIFCREINDLKEYMGNKICSKCASNISK